MAMGAADRAAKRQEKNQDIYPNTGGMSASDRASTSQFKEDNSVLIQRYQEFNDDVNKKKLHNKFLDDNSPKGKDGKPLNQIQDAARLLEKYNIVNYEQFNAYFNGYDDEDADDSDRYDDERFENLPNWVKKSWGKQGTPQYETNKKRYVNERNVFKYHVGHGGSEHATKDTPNYAGTDWGRGVGSTIEYDPKEGKQVEVIKNTFESMMNYLLQQRKKQNEMHIIKKQLKGIL